LSLAQRVRRLKREVTPEEENPIVLVVIEGNPDACPERPMVSAREAMIGDTHHVPLDGESTADFHARLKQVYRATNARGLIVLGHPDNAAPPPRPIFNVEGALIEPAPDLEPETLH
jgi:hypothetical protein